MNHTENETTRADILAIFDLVQQIRAANNHKISNVRCTYSGAADDTLIVEIVVGQQACRSITATIRIDNATSDDNLYAREILVDWLHDWLRVASL